MTTWNYRLMRDEKTGEYLFCEVYYSHDKTPEGYTAASGDITSDADSEKEARKDLRWTLKKMLGALDKPLFDGSECRSGDLAKAIKKAKLSDATTIEKLRSIIERT